MITASTGSLSASDCICDIGWFFNGLSCTLCPRGWQTASTEALLVDDCSVCPTSTYEQQDGSIWCPISMINLRLAYDDIEAKRTLMITGGTYTGTRMGSSGIAKAMTMECVVGGDECVIDGHDDHRCLYIRRVDEAGEWVTIKRIKVTNGYAEFGGGIYILHSTATLVMVSIINNKGGTGVSTLRFSPNNMYTNIFFVRVEYAM